MPDANYDGAVLYIDPDGLKSDASALAGLAQNVADSLSNIERTLMTLDLGWAGQTADEAQDFGRRWETVMKELFGGAGHPETGVLNVIVSGLTSVRGNFALVEGSLTDFFTQFGEGLEGGSGETPTSSPPNLDNIDLTAITETW